MRFYFNAFSDKILNILLNLNYQWKSFAKYAIMHYVGYYVANFAAKEAQK